MILEIQEKTGASLRKICNTLRIPRSSFYHAAQLSLLDLSEKKAGDQIEIIFKRHRGRYGHRRIRQQMAEEGVICSSRRVRKLMKNRGLRAIAAKNFICTSSDLN